MTVKLLTEPHLRFLSLNGRCKALSESTHVKMPHCHGLMAHLVIHLWVPEIELTVVPLLAPKPNAEKERWCLMEGVLLTA